MTGTPIEHLPAINCLFYPGATLSRWEVSGIVR